MRIITYLGSDCLLEKIIGLNKKKIVGEKPFKILPYLSFTGKLRSSFRFAKYSSKVGDTSYNMRLHIRC
jgi:hypothetical protein